MVKLLVLETSSPSKGKALRSLNRHLKTLSTIISPGAKKEEKNLKKHFQGLSISEFLQNCMPNSPSKQKPWA
jgi:hypothetical protein